MTGAVRLGDLGSGHGCFPPHNVIQGNPKVLIDGIPASTIGDALVPHCCGPVCHPGFISSGEQKVLVGGRPLAKIGDFVSCGSILVSGSLKVIVGEYQGIPQVPDTVTLESGEVVNIPEEYKGANSYAILQEAGRYALFDEPDSIEVSPSSLPEDKPKANVIDNPTKPPVEAPAPKKTPNVQDCANITGIDYEMQLSPHFKLANFSTKALFRHTIKAQAGFTEKEIICNLQGLSQQVLEKIWVQYPGFRINSGFRTFTVGKSQHEKGQACDIQWPGITNQEYKVRANWIKSNLVYDQLLFEHGNAIWIHVSFNRTRTTQRQEVKTMYKGKFEPGIVLYYN